ncbi:pilus assembly protein TadG-related protein [Bacillus sp. B-jedd]|uniref:pilus assembly protein TadG-related protein n=1 Tax=Bacillus sp. B-jedd TaxID=1476857 RepID=UPI0005155D8C|nr:Tad domain-containing protein [Bacillus sp. B-jedd]CEG28320.1 hypothetical protein BN1002_03230 [Bacillus sp. B-jedd]
MKKILKNEDGNVLVIVAVFMIALFGFTAMVVDAGGLFLEKSKLQKALDAAVLAGAQDLISSETKAKQTAMLIADKNNFKLTTSDLKTGPDYIQATKTISKGLTFAKILGINSSEVKAFSKAIVGGSLISSKGVVPVGVLSKEYKANGKYIMHFQPGNPDNAAKSGNFGFLDLTEEKGNNLKNEIINGAELKVSDDMHSWTQTGLQWGNVKAGFEARISADKNAGRTYCENASTADDSCKRVIIVPMVEDFDGASGTSEVKIVGFAMFWIESVDKHAITGQFIKEISIGEFGTGKDFGIYKVSLIE